MRFSVYVAACTASIFCANVVEATQINTDTDTKADALVGVKVEAPVETEPEADTDYSVAEEQAN